MFPLSAYCLSNPAVLERDFLSILPWQPAQRYDLSVEGAAGTLQEESATLLAHPLCSCQRSSSVVQPLQARLLQHMWQPASAGGQWHTALSWGDLYLRSPLVASLVDGFPLQNSQPGFPVCQSLLAWIPDEYSLYASPYSNALLASLCSDQLWTSSGPEQPRGLLSPVHFSRKAWIPAFGSGLLFQVCSLCGDTPSAPRFPLLG